MIFYLPKMSFWLVGAVIGTFTFLIATALLISEMPKALTPTTFQKSAQQRTIEGRANYQHFLQNIDKAEYRSNITGSVDNWGPGEMLLTAHENFTMLAFRNSKTPILLIFPSRSGTTGTASSPSTFSDLMVRYKIPMMTAFW